MRAGWSWDTTLGIEDALLLHLGRSQTHIDKATFPALRVSAPFTCSTIYSTQRLH